MTSVTTTADAVEKPSSAAARSVGIDLARVVGLVAIVAGHAWDGHEVSVLLFSWHVPIFFLLTGYLWRPGRPLGAEVRKRARTLLVPYVLWYLIVAGIWFTYASQVLYDDFDWHAAARTALGGVDAPRPFSAFWFVTALFAATVALRALEKLGPWAPWLVAALMLGLFVQDRVRWAGVYWSAATGVACLVFVLAGQVLRTHRDRVPLPLVTGIALVLVGLVPVVAGDVMSLNLKAGVFGTPYLSVLCAIAISIGVLLVCEWAAQVLPAVLLRPVVPLATAALPLLFTHTLVMAFIDANSDPSTRWWLFWTALLLPWALGLLIGRTRLRSVLL
ncbi:acyltransferase family protein [Aeromicrobium sp. IC_218]|uniref:acyltransferase family protein n=1 Tax=Aeromicrobium sp. IC_218 TaxID=2545468 RepID=UPI001040DE37|nr:acyltransferase family protein [Aeromicrobium sp. IC_218]TCI99731.1 acyltransferase [Aeromicrobium sp. IC_218]